MGVDQDNETDTTTKVLLGRDFLNNMSHYQLKRPVDLIHATPAVEQSIKRLRKTLVLEEIKNGNVFKVRGAASQINILAKPLQCLAAPTAQYKRINSPILQSITDGVLPIDTLGLEKALKKFERVFYGINYYQWQ